MPHRNILNGAIETLDNPGLNVGEILYRRLKNSKNPNNTALIDAVSGQTFTTGEVFRKSVQAASKLYELGVRHGDMVGIVSENRVDFIFPVLGCYYLGAAINPLNPDYISPEITHAFEISQPKFVISSKAKLSDVHEAQTNIASLETVVAFEDLEVYSLDANNNEPSFKKMEANLQLARNIDTKNDVALVLCSSGTTGLPKGVAITHDNMKNCFIHFYSPDAFSINSSETIMALLPFFHIMGFFVLLSCFLCHAKAVVLSKFKPDLFLTTIQSYKITKMFIVPPLALFLSKYSATKEYDLSSITDVLCGAAPLGSEIQASLEEKLGVSIRQAYGLTEACAVAVAPRGSVRPRPGSSGKLLSNIEAKVVDPITGKTLSANETGEFCLKSPCVMKGYLQNEKATQEIFDKEGFMHTGDIGYYDDDGYIFIVERLKELIKYKGFQVPPAELEDILMTHDEIKDAAVIGIKDEHAGELARAYVVKSEGSQITEDTVKEFVAKHVSMQKHLYGGVEFIDSIPKSASGKILRKELRKLAGDS